MHPRNAKLEDIDKIANAEFDRAVAAIAIQHLGSVLAIRRKGNPLETVMNVAEFKAHVQKARCSRRFAIS